MRVLVLSKRQYTGKDLLDDRYGRLFEIPSILAARGNEVTGVALSYRCRRGGWYRWEDQPGLSWFSINAFPAGFWLYPRLLGKITADFRPDVVWACSDAFHGIAGSLLSSRFGTPLVIDLYDNFDSFAGTRLPGVKMLFHRACRSADGLTVVSHALAGYVAAKYGPSMPPQVLGNAVPRGLFFPRSKIECRKTLGLPLDKRLIGTVGAITESRGISALFEAFLRLAARDRDLWLVFAGPRDDTPRRYRHERIIDLGTIGADKVPVALNSLDVGVVCNLDSDFGRYCFPQKFYEMVACGLPLAAANVGEMKSLLARWPQLMFAPNSVTGLAECLRRQLSDPMPLSAIHVPTWEDRALELEHFLGCFVPCRRKRSALVD